MDPMARNLLCCEKTQSSPQVITKRALEEVDIWFQINAQDADETKNRGTENLEIKINNNYVNHHQKLENCRRKDQKIGLISSDERKYKIAQNNHIRSSGEIVITSLFSIFTLSSTNLTKKKIYFQTRHSRS